MKKRLGRDFFERPAVEVAPDLLGKIIVRKIGNKTISGKIVETEAYVGEEDLASHARNGKTERNKVMYSRGGLVYIYLIYGMYYNFNIVAAKEHVPEAVLIRALEPIDGLGLAKQNLKKFGRVRADKDFMRGPGKLCAALDLDKLLYGEDITNSEKIWVEDSSPFCHSDLTRPARRGRLREVTSGGIPYTEKFEIETSKRIGIDYADIYRNKLWRYTIKGNKFVSKYKEPGVRSF